MKATINGTQIKGFFGQHLDNGSKWLFVNGTSSKTIRNSYAIAKVLDNGDVIVEPRQQLSDFTNEQIVAALLNA